MRKMYVETSFGLLVLGIICLLSKEKSKRLCGITLSLTTPNLLLVKTGAWKLLIITMVLETAGFCVLLLIYLLKGEKHE